jgi:YggT family protein
MSVASAIFSPIITTIFWLLKIYEYVLIIAIFLSWVNPDPYNPLVRFIYSLTEPVLSFFREKIPLRLGIIDFSPVFVFIIIEILKNLLIMLAFKIK